MDAEQVLIAWVVIAIVLALASIVNAWQWYKVTIKILELHKQIRDLTEENKELREKEAKWNAGSE